MLLLLPGVPASGEPPPAAGAARNAAEGYKHLSEEQRAKLTAALERQVCTEPIARRAALECETLDRPPLGAASDCVACCRAAVLVERRGAERFQPQRCSGGGPH